MLRIPLKWKSQVSELHTTLGQANATVRCEKVELRLVSKRLAACWEAQQLTQQVAQLCQNHAHKQIAQIVSKALEAVFDSPYVFRIIFDRKRGKTEARLVFERDGLEVDPMHQAGGGVIDVAAFALRVAALILSRPKLRKVLVLDEPFKYVSKEYRPRVRQLLESLSKDLHIQIIMVTHDPMLQAGTVIDLGEME